MFVWRLNTYIYVCVFVLPLIFCVGIDSIARMNEWTIHTWMCVRFSVRPPVPGLRTPHTHIHSCSFTTKTKTAAISTAEGKTWLSKYDTYHLYGWLSHSRFPHFLLYSVCIYYCLSWADATFFCWQGEDTGLGCPSGSSTPPAPTLNLFTQPSLTVSDMAFFEM